MPTQQAVKANATGCKCRYNRSCEPIRLGVSVLEAAGDGAALSADERFVEFDTLGLGAGIGDSEGAAGGGEGVGSYAT